MTALQKVIKYFAIALAVFLTVSIIGGILSAIGIFGFFFSDDYVTEEMTTYPVSGEIRKLEININAADLYIREGDAFSVESNLKHLNVREKDGTLTVEQTQKFRTINDDASLTVYIPSATTLENTNLTTGAGRLTVDRLSSERVKFELGAGDVTIEHLSVSHSADIDGGAGRITVSEGEVCDLDLDMGLGQLNICVALRGECKLDLGVGESNITLIGSREDYAIDIDKGIGSITVDGESVTDYGSNSDGDCELDINGGVGSINVKFKEAEAK